MTHYTPTHEDWAEEAESAERGRAWPQAAALWRRAAKTLRDTAPNTPETFDVHAEYLVAAERCDARHQVGQVLEEIARKKLRIPTLQERKSDNLDFHEVDIWSVREALEAAYEAGRKDAK